MGNVVRPCVNYVSPVNELGLYGWSLTTACDEWAAPHIVSPLFLAIITFWPYFAWNVAGYWEALEVFFVWVSGGFLIFVGVGSPGAGATMADDETFVMALIEDWFIQGTIGAVILGNLFLLVTKPPVLWRLKDIYYRPKYFWFYALMVIAYFAPYAFFSYVDESSGIKVGQLIIIAWQPLWTCAMLFLEGRWMGQWSATQNGTPVWYSGRWRGRKNADRLWFWWGFVLMAEAFFVQNYFDWFFSNGVQSWFVASILIVVLVTILVIRYSGKDGESSFIGQKVRSSRRRKH